MARRTPTPLALPSEFALNLSWPTQGVEPAAEHLSSEEATVGRVSVELGGEYVTEFKSDKGDTGVELEIPTIHLAEWIANNYWALLYEPKKSDQEDDLSFKARHWLGSARNGFALPNLWICSSGEKVEVSARGAYLRFARLTFEKSVSHHVERHVLQASLASFVDAVAKRVSQTGVAAGEFMEAWDLVKSTGPTEVPYCRLIGSLGGNPYDDCADIDRTLESLSEILSADALLDLCQAAEEANLRQMGEEAAKAYSALPNAQAFEARELHAIDVPADREDQPAWRWGVAGSERMRNHLGISAREPGDELLRHFGISVGEDVIQMSTGADYSTRVAAALSAEEGPESTVRVALAEARAQQRRFSAARAVFLAWSRENRGVGRLVTGARTRDQQASRAFAAELLAPIAFIRAKSGSGPVSNYRLDEIARDLHVSPAVVRYQAQNNKVRVVD